MSTHHDCKHGKAYWQHCEECNSINTGGGQPISEELNTHCAVCGMPSAPKEYHPLAACLMFQACHNSETVKANLNAVIEHGNTRTEKKWKYATVEDLRVGIYICQTPSSQIIYLKRYSTPQGKQNERILSI